LINETAKNEEAVVDGRPLISSGADLTGTTTRSFLREQTSSKGLWDSRDLILIMGGSEFGSRAIMNKGTADTLHDGWQIISFSMALTLPS